MLFLNGCFHTSILLFKNQKKKKKVAFYHVQYYKNDSAGSTQHGENFSALQYPHGTNGVVLNQMKLFQVFKSSLF